MTPLDLGNEVVRAARDRRWDDVDRFLARLVALADAQGLQRLSVIEVEKLRDVRPQPLEPSE